MRLDLKTKVYIQQFVGDCMPIYPLYALMFADKTGLNTGEITVLFGWWTLVALLSEVPTGIIADKFSRKSALIYSYVLQALGFSVWLFLPSFLGYAIGFLLWGIGYAFQSGTFQAYLFEELKVAGRKSEFNKIYARSVSINLFAMVLAYVVATMLGPNSYSIALIMSIVMSLVAGLVTVSFPYHSKRSPGDFVPENYISTLKSAVQEVRQSDKALVYVAGLAAIMGILGVSEEYVPLFYSFVGFSNTVVPVLLAIGIAISTAIGWYAHRLEKLAFMKVALLATAAGCFLMIGTIGGQWVGLIGMMTLMRLLLLAEVLLDMSLQHVIRDERRATVSSLAAFGGEGLSVVIFALIGGVAFSLGDMAAYQGLAGMTIFISILIMLLARKKQVKTALATSSGVV
jgi:MFS family permease